MKVARRKPLVTILAVGEGTAEEELLRHLKSIYITRDSGISVTIKNARGKGAAHVIDVARRYSHGADFRIKVALLDTDQDWNSGVQKEARLAKVHVLESTPCLESTLLAIHQHPTEGLSSAQLKRQFEMRFGSPASSAAVYAAHFDAETIQLATARVPLIARLIALLAQGSWD